MTLDYNFISSYHKRVIITGGANIGPGAYALPQNLNSGMKPVSPPKGMDHGKD